MAAPDTLRGHTALVTGASSGIGLEFCRRLAEKGCNLVMVSNQPSELDRHAAEIAGRHGVTATPLCIDLTGGDCAEKLDQWLDRNAPRTDILINNAGIFAFRPVAEMEPERIQAFIDLHVRAVTMLSRMAARRFARLGGGRILNMSSMSCWMPMPGLAMYAATKAYIRVFTRSLAYETAEQGVHIMAACPGGIATSLFGLPPHLQRLAVRLGCLDTPERFTRRALGRLLRGRRQYINGLLNRISIVFVACLPARARLAVKHRLLDRGITR